MRPVLLAWSSGKDSPFCLHVLRSQGVEVGGLLTTMNADDDVLPAGGRRRASA